MSKKRREAHLNHQIFLRNRRKSRRAARREARNRSRVAAVDRLRSNKKNGQLDERIKHLRGRMRVPGEVAARHDALVALAERKMPQVLTDAGLRLLLEVAAQAWERPLAAWKPRGKAATTRLRSLLAHLLLRYPAPRVLMTELVDSIDRPSQTGLDRQKLHTLRLLLALGSGASPRALQRSGLLPACLTKRMLSRALSVPAPTFVAAVRQAQVEAFGGSRALRERIMASFLGEDLQAEPAFWQSVIQWLCSQQLLDPGQVRPLLDYIRHQRRERADFSMRGRTAAALIRGMEAWHAALRQIAIVRQHTFAPSGLPVGRFSVKVSEEVSEVWTVTEILTAKALAAEGRAMSHCVYSYRSAVASGRTSIWSVARDGERRVTVEVSNQTRTIVQARGACNRMPRSEALSILRRWCKAAGLVMGAAAVR